MRLRKLHELVPPWTDGKPFLFSYLALLALCLAISAYNSGGMLSLALSQVHVYGQPDVVDPGSRMTDFADLVGIQGAVSNFFSHPALFPFLLLLGAAAALAAVNRLSFLRGSRSDYLLRRLPDRRELARRAYALPLLLILATLGTMVLALAVYYAVYLALTPPECLQPNQLGKLWDNFGYLFTPYYERWLP